MGSRIITIWKGIWGFFPTQLLILHFKKSHLLLLLWFLLFGIITQNVATKLGLPYLFLSPEYLSEVSFFSFLILGFAFGGFFMAFHLYSYILLGPSFPFIATLSRPFFKFSVNNSIIPIVFYVLFVFNMAQVQLYEELKTYTDVLMDLTGFTLGIVSFIILAVLYFFSTNIDVLKLQNKSRRSLYTRVRGLLTKNEYWFKPMTTKKYYPKSYLSNLVRVAMARDAAHYDREQIKEIFRQNQLNASFFEIIAILSFLLIGYLQDYEVVKIPAAASIILLFTLVLMALNIFYSWFKGWAISVVIGIFLLMNILSTSGAFLKENNQAYGLSYKNQVSYTLDNLRAIQFNKEDVDNDIKKHEGILDRWLVKAKAYQKNEKPKLVIINSSGGGLRSAMWTFYVLQEIDKASDKKFFANVHMMTGASGGMIGASYYRELYQEEINSEKVNRLDAIYLENIAKDMLNSVSSQLATHDLFLRYKHFEIGDKKYFKDRGYAFEEQLNKNTDFTMDKPLGEYHNAEKSAEIPLMIFTPTIVNDGRRLVFSTQPSAFLNGKEFESTMSGPENIEAIKLFKNNDVMDVRFTTVLRMNSTFPYILPMVSMPTIPATQVMDAGIRDNYGTKTTVRYIDGVKDWIQKNTSGVVIVEIRDIAKDYDLYDDSELSMFKKLVRPVGNFYGNFHHSMEYNSAELFALEEDIPLEIISFTLRQSPKDKIALSWHLTNREKVNIKRIFQNEGNQTALKNLIDLLGIE